MMANKHQMLLNTVMNGLVSGRKDLCAEDADALWCCMKDMLHVSTKQFVFTSASSVCTVNDKFVKLLLDELELLVSSSDISIVRCSTVVSCCYSLLCTSSSIIALDLTSRFENMMRMVTLVIDLVLRTSSSAMPNFHATLSTLLLLSVHHYASCQRQKAEINKVMVKVSSKVLLHFVRLTHLIHVSSDVNTDLLKAQQQLEECISSAVFPKEFLPHYEVYLQRSVEKVDIARKSSHFISDLFIILLSSYQANMNVKEVVHGIAWLFRKFTSCYLQFNDRIPLLLLRYLIESFCTGVSFTKPEGSSVDQSKSAYSNNKMMDQRLHLLALLLEATRSLNVYDAVQDATNDWKTLHWLKSLAAWFLSSDVSCCSHWFRCVQQMLLLKPEALEPKLVGILSLAWASDPTTLADEAQFTRDAMLVDLVQVFSRLHQVEKFVHAMLVAARTASGRTYLNGEFLKSLATCFNELDQITVADIWAVINAELSSHHAGELYEPLRTLRLEATVDLVSVYIRNVTVTGHSISQTSQAKISDLLQSTITYILLQLDGDGMKQKNSAMCAASLLKLLYSCGELLLLQRTYSSLPNSSVNQSEPENTGGDGREFSDLSLLFPVWKRKQWSKFHYFVTSSQNLELLLYWEKLLVLGVQFDQCYLHKMSPSVLVQIGNFMLNNSSWNVPESTCPNMEVTAVKTIVAAHWSTILDNICILFCSDDISESNTLNVARFLLSASLSVDATKEVADGFMSTATFLEMPLLHSCLVHSAVGEMHSLLPSVDKPRAKSRKHCKGENIIVKSIGRICDLPISIASDAELIGFVEPIITDLSEHLLKQCGDVECTYLTEANVNRFAAVLKFLELLPIEFVSSMCQVKCILLAVTVLAAVSFNCEPNFSDSSRDVILHSVFSILRCSLFDGFGLRTILSALQSGLLLQWFLAVYQKINKMNVELSQRCVSVIRQLVHVSTKHSSSIEHLSKFVDHTLEQYREAKSSAGSMKHITHILATVLEMQTKVLKRPYVRPENRAALCQLNDSIVSIFTKAISSTNGDDDRFETATAAATSATDVLAADFPVLLLGVSNQLEYLFLLREASDDSIKLRKKTVTWLPALCQKCLLYLRTSDNFNTTTAHCLRFILSICYCHDGLDNKLPAGFLIEACRLLIGHHHKIGLPSFAEDYIRQPVEDGERSCLETTVAEIIGVLETSDFNVHLEQLQKDMVSGEPVKLYSALRISDKLLSKAVQLPTDKRSAIASGCQKILLSVQQLLSVESTNLAVVIAAVQVETSLVAALESSVITTSELSLCLHWNAALDSPSVTDNLECFIAVCHAWHGLLNACIIYHAETVFRMIPTYVSCVRQLLKAIMRAGTQHLDVGRRYSEQQLDRVMDCVRLFDRLASLICSHKVDFAKAVPYIVADYVSVAQKVTLYPVVKRTLVLAVYKLLDVCNHHSIRQLNVALPPGAREVFRTVYADFNKYFRYSRRAVDEDKRNAEFIDCLYNI